MATKNYQQPLTPDSTEADEYIRQIRAQRLAQLLNQEAQAPIDYDPRGAISQSQLLAKALAGSGSILANAQADRQAAEMMAARNAQQRALFSGQGGMGGNPFMPNNMSGEQSRYMLQNNPDKYWEMVANNNQITNEQKNAQAGFGRGAGNYMQAQQLANLQKQEGEAAKAGLIEMGQGQTLFNAQTGAPQYATNQLFNQDLGNRKDIVAANPLSGQSGVVRSDAVGVDPNGPVNAASTKPPVGYRYKADGSMEPIPGGPADAKARALEEQKATGAADVDLTLGTLRDAYDRLEEGKGITSTKNGALGNIGASISSSAVGQMAGRAVGSQNQSARNDIAMSRPALLAAIMKSSGMSSKQLDSNSELKLWITTATDPTLDIESNRRALNNIEAKYLRNRTPESNQTDVQDINSIYEQYKKDRGRQ